MIKVKDEMLFHLKKGNTLKKKKNGRVWLLLRVRVYLWTQFKVSFFFYS